MNQENIYICDNKRLMAEWNWEKNDALGYDPTALTTGAGRIVWWKCDNGHEWDDSILHRSQGRNCPYCSNHRILPGYNNLFATNPELEAEWDYDKNTLMDPMRTTAGSHERVWWICTKGHNYQSVIRERVKGNGCPYCSNKKILVGYNDLATTDPDLAAEWNYEKNGELLPTQIVVGSSQKVWWKCKTCGHEWEATVNNRSKNHGCPACARIRVQQLKRQTELSRRGSLLQNNPELAAEWDYERNDVTPADVFPNSSAKAWWICSRDHHYEASPNNRIHGRNCPYCSN